MAATSKKRKGFDAAEAEAAALREARERQAARKRIELQEALSRWITEQGAWIVSRPGALRTRIEARRGSNFVTKLIELGYEPRHCGAGTRILGGSFEPVDVVEITLGK